MEEMTTGLNMWPVPKNQNGKNFDFKDSEWMMLLIVSMFGGDEFREAMMKAAMDKAKEVIERGKQFVPESTAAAESAE